MSKRSEGEVVFLMMCQECVGVSARQNRTAVLLDSAGMRLVEKELRSHWSGFIFDL
jgi:hypothetical protein